PGSAGLPVPGSAGLHCSGVPQPGVGRGSGIGYWGVVLALSSGLKSPSLLVKSLPEPGPFGLLGREGAEGVDISVLASLRSPAKGEAMAGALRPDTSTITAAPVRTILFIDFLIFVSFLLLRHVLLPSLRRMACFGAIRN
ncbi:MAG TPA: hypothetical protein VHF70_09815, partial [Rubrobacteraceae bacterium]|nr:hypothetical protein [Rubrobacteraceae bacterium]